MERIDTLLNMLREEISRSISEEISSSGKPVVHLASSKVAESTRADASNSTKKSDQKFPNRSPAQIEAAQNAFKRRWAKATPSIYHDIC